MPLRRLRNGAATTKGGQHEFARPGIQRRRRSKARRGRVGTTRTVLEGRRRELTLREKLQECDNDCDLVIVVIVADDACWRDVVRD